MQSCFDDWHEDVSRDGDPDLGLYRVLGSSEERLDAKMLLDPPEEQFDLPALPIELGDGQRRHGEVVGKKDQAFARFRIAKADPAQRCREVFARRAHHESDRLIADQATGAVDGMGVAAAQARPERPAQMPG